MCDPSERAPSTPKWVATHRLRTTALIVQFGPETCHRFSCIVKAIWKHKLVTEIDLFTVWPASEALSSPHPVSVPVASLKLLKSPVKGWSRCQLTCQTEQPAPSWGGDLDIG